MGRNGAGKSTLLRLLAGLVEPTRGRVDAGRPGGAAAPEPGRLLPARPRSATTCPGAGALADRHPRDVSGGERQRLALELVLATGEPPVAVCLDEPTRGMDRGHGARLAARLRELAAGGAAVLVATHDAEFAAAWADRTVLLGDGRPVADAPTAEVLGGGWYFATQTARVLGGGALLPEEGAALLRASPPREEVRVSWVAASTLLLGDRARRRLRVVRAGAPDRARDRARGDARRARRARPDRVRADPERQADHRHRADLRLRARRRARVRGRRGGGAGLEPLLRPGPVDAVADGRLGRRRRSPARGLARVAGRELGRIPLAAACAAASLGFGAVMNLHLWVTLLRRPHRRQARRPLRHLAAVRRRPRGRQRRCSASRSGRRSCSALARYRTRFEIRWLPAAATAAARALASRSPPRRRARTPRRRRTRPPRAPPSATSPTPRTTTAAGAPRPASRRPQLYTRLDGARAGGRRAQPARRRLAERASPTSAPTRASSTTSASSTARSSCSRAAGLEPRLGGRDLEREVAASQRRNGSFAGRVNTTAFAILGLRAAGRSTQRPGDPARGRLDRERGQRRRRLQLRRPRRSVGDRRHRRRAAGARRRRPPAQRRRSSAPCGSSCATRPPTAASR